MPLLVRYPAEIPAGTTNDDLVSNLDFAPTILDWAGRSAPSEMQGLSLRSLAAGSAVENRRSSLYYHYYEYPGPHMVKRHYGIRTPQYKLMHFYEDIDDWELYDLEKDPREQNNLYADPEYSDRVAELKSELSSLREYYGDSEQLDRRFIREDAEKAEKRRK